MRYKPRLRQLRSVLNGDVSVTLRTASRFAKALQMDFVPMLTPKTDDSAEVVPQAVMA